MIAKLERTSSDKYQNNTQRLSPQNPIRGTISNEPTTTEPPLERTAAKATRRLKCI